PSSRQTARRSACGHASARFTANGRSVSRRVSRTIARVSSTSYQETPSIPRPPAFETAAASGGTAHPPMGAWSIGSSMPSNGQSGVRRRAGTEEETCSGRRALSRRAERLELGEDPVEALDDLGVSYRLGRGLPREEADRPAGLEHGALHLV